MQTVRPTSSGLDFLRTLIKQCDSISPYTCLSHSKHNIEQNRIVYELYQFVATTDTYEIGIGSWFAISILDKNCVCISVNLAIKLSILYIHGVKSVTIAPTRAITTCNGTERVEYKISNIDTHRLNLQIDKGMQSIHLAITIWNVSVLINSKLDIYIYSVSPKV